MRHSTTKARAIAIADTEARVRIGLIALGLLVLPALLLLLTGP